MASLTSTFYKLFGVQTETIPITYCDDQVMFTNGEVWTYMLTEGAPIGVPKNEELVDHIEKVTKALENTRERECHLYLATRAFDTEKWLHNVLDKQTKESAATGVKPAPAFERIVIEQATAMRRRGYKQYSRYLGVKLGKRKTVGDTVLGEEQTWYKKAFQTSKARAERGAKALDPVPSEAEVRYWTAKALEVRTRLSMSSALNARGATARDMYELIWHISTLGMNVPPPARAPKGAWGAFELSAMETDLSNERINMLELSVPNPHLVVQYETYERLTEEYENAANQDILVPPVRPEAELKSYVVALSTKLPDAVAVPWLLQSTTGRESVDASIRFTVQSKKQSKEEAGKAATALSKEIQHQEQSGIYGGTAETSYKYGLAKQHADTFNIGAGRAQVEFSCRFFVHSASPDQTRLDAERFITRFEEDLDTKLEWVKDGQGTFYLEAVPGSTTRSEVHYEKGDIDVLSNAMPFGTRHIGHQSFGWYLGSYGQLPLLYDFAEVARQGKAPTCVAHGSLGGGKTSAIMEIIDSFMLRSYTGIIFDPKGDFRSLFALPGRGHFRYWNLTRDGKAGMLDPFILNDKEVIANDPERDTAEKALTKWKEATKTVVIDTIARTLGRNMTGVQEEILAALVDAEMETNSPSMEALMERMRRGEIGSFVEDTQISDETLIATRQAASYGMYSLLKSASLSSLGRLIYGKRDGEVKLLFKGVPTTVINLSGLDLPQDGAAPDGPNQNISVTIFSLLCSYAVQLLKDPQIKGSKYLVVDEANVVKGLPAFITMTANINSQARSLGITAFYIDQSSATSTKDASAFSNKIGTRIVFRSTKAERVNIANEIGWEGNDKNNLVGIIPHETETPGKALITTQPDKFSIYPNFAGMGVVQFDRDWNPEYADAFETNDDGSGFVRAAFRSYPFDAAGILHDPLAPAVGHLEAMVTSFNDKPATVSDYAAQELEADRAYLPAPQAPMSVHPNLEQGTEGQSFHEAPGAQKSIVQLRTDLAETAPAAAAQSEAESIAPQVLDEATAEQEKEPATLGGFF